jgi:hypothetical protein
MNTQPVRPIAIPMEDDLVHTPQPPYCNDPACPCHSDPLYRELVVRETLVPIPTEGNVTDE